MNIMQQRRDYKVNWEKVNPILAEGQIGFEMDVLPWKRKVGHDNLPWKSLEYEATGGGGTGVPYASRIVALGDSLTAGYPYTDNSPVDAIDVYSWTSVIRNYLGINIHNKGIGGQTTAELLARMSTDVIANKPTHCIIEGGINDVVHTEKAVSASGTQSNFQAMISLCNSNDIIPIVAIGAPISTASPFVTAGMVTDYNSRMTTLRSYCSTNDIQLIDFYPQFIENVSGNIITSLIYATDNLHPNEEGYLRMGYYAVYRLKQILPEFIGTLSPIEDYLKWYSTGMSPRIGYKTGELILNALPTVGDHVGFSCSEDGSPGKFLSTGRFRNIGAVIQNATKIITQADTTDYYWEKDDIFIVWDASVGGLSGYRVTVAGYSAVHSVVGERATFTQIFSMSEGSKTYTDSYSSPNTTRLYKAGDTIYFPNASTGEGAVVFVLTGGYAISSSNTPHITYSILGVK